MKRGPQSRYRKAHRMSKELDQFGYKANIMPGLLAEMDT